MTDYGGITLHLRKGTVVGIRPAATIVAHSEIIG